MLAIKCDRCGSFDEPYVNSTDIIALSKRIKHIDKGTFDAGSKDMWCLCGNCVKKFEEFMNNDRSK